MRPSFSSDVEVTRFTSSYFERSAGIAYTLAPVSVASLSRAPFSGSLVRAQMTIAAPSMASSRAMA